MNPVYDAEIRYQDYVIRTNRSSSVWIAAAVLLLIPGLLTALITTIGHGIFQAELPAVALFSTSGTPGETLYNIGLVALITMNFAHYLVLALVSSGLAIFSIQREYRNHTWELLVLTGVSARQIVMGKIRASMWVVRRDFYMVTLMRVGLVAFALDFITPAYPDAAFTLGQFLLLALFVVTWTAFDVVLSITSAVTSALIPHLRSILMPAAFFARGLVVFGGVWWLARIIDALYQNPADSGYALIGLAGLVFFGVIVVISLKIAELSARAAHAAPVRISQAISQPRPLRQA